MCFMRRYSRAIIDCIKRPFFGICVVVVVVVVILVLCLCLKHFTIIHLLCTVLYVRDF